MREIMQAVVELDAAAAHAIAAAMRELAHADGSHPDEEALINAFEAELPPVQSASLADVNTPEAREALLKSLVLVAFADGRMSDLERARIVRFAAEVGQTEEDVARATIDVAGAMLSNFEGVHVFREQVVALGRQLGLSDDMIGKIIG